MDAGTEILIDLPDAWERGLDYAAAVAARYFPLPVTLNGRDLAREDFLAGACSIEIVDGCQIGVFLNRHFHSGEPGINFHGVALAAALPDLQEQRGGAFWGVRVDIVDAPDLSWCCPPARKW